MKIKKLLIKNLRYLKFWFLLFLSLFSKKKVNETRFSDFKYLFETCNIQKWNSNNSLSNTL